MGDNDNFKKLRKPYDISLPFFAYGVLKPGEIAYSRIKDLIYDGFNLMMTISQIGNQAIEVIGNIYENSNLLKGADNIE